MLEHTRKCNFRFGDKKIVISKSTHDSEWQVYAKALAFAMYHKKYPSLRIEAKVDERFQPDLSAEGYDGKMLFWCECGTVSMEKVEKLIKKYRGAHFVFIKNERDVPMFEKHLQRQLKNIPSLPLMDIVIYPPMFHEWWVSEEGDVFLPPDEVKIIRWHDPDE
jgi:hypothetical protein